FSLVRHVAIGTGDPRAGVNALTPHLEFGMLRLQNLGAGLSMLPVIKSVSVGESVLVVMGFYLLDLQTFGPGEKQRCLGPAVVLDVALATDERAHLLT